MKHALITLIVVFIFVLIVVPLLYISLGKLKNPVDLFALNKVQKTGGMTQKSNFITPNYIPESGSVGKVSQVSESYAKRIEDVNSCFSKDSLQTISKEYISLTKSDSTRLSVKNNVTGTIRYFEGFYPKIETEISFLKLENSNLMSTMAFLVRPGCATQGTPDSELLLSLNDLGMFQDRISNTPVDMYDFTNKGLTNINGLPYYWYLYEHKSRLLYHPSDETKERFYIATYSTYANGVFYSHAFMGSSITFGTSRDFLNKTQYFLSGITYGTSTPAYSKGVATSTAGVRQ